MENEPVIRRIADLDVNDKPREKALKYGVGSLSNAELIAIILGSGMQGRSVLDLSQIILKGCDNRLSRLARCNIHELTSKYKGVGTAKAISLLSAIELGSRCVSAFVNEEEEPQIKSSRDIHAYMRTKLQAPYHEEFWVLYLNRANRVMSAECISKGGVASTIVDLKIILKGALDKLACGIVLVHNHPSGNLIPSHHDDNITHLVVEAAKLVDMKVIDHLIISQSGFYSYFDEGRLK